MTATTAAIERATEQPRQAARLLRGGGGAGGVGSAGGCGGVLNAHRLPGMLAQRNRKEIDFFSVKSALPFSFSK